MNTFLYCYNNTGFFRLANAGARSLSINPYSRMRTRTPNGRGEGAGRARTRTSSGRGKSADRARVRRLATPQFREPAHSQPPVPRARASSKHKPSAGSHVKSGASRLPSVFAGHTIEKPRDGAKGDSGIRDKLAVFFRYHIEGQRGRGPGPPMTACSPRESILLPEKRTSKCLR